MALGRLLSLTNVGTSYDATNALKALGLATVEMTGFDTVKITVYVNKIGTGTQNWQLYNVTDTVQVALIADAGATGEKYLATTVTRLARPHRAEEAARQGQLHRLDGRPRLLRRLRHLPQDDLSGTGQTCR